MMFNMRGSEEQSNSALLHLKRLSFSNCIIADLSTKEKSNERKKQDVQDSRQIQKNTCNRCGQLVLKLFF